MNDEELEKALRRYRVVEPPRSLAARILARGVTRGSGHVWGAVAAAAIAAMWIGAHAMLRSSVQDPLRERDVSAIAAALGEGRDARQYAEAVVPRRETTVTSDVAPELSW